MPDGAPIHPTEIIHAGTRTVACDGGGGTLGHPKVYLRITFTQTMCPYCSRLFVLDENAPPADHPASGISDH